MITVGELINILDKYDSCLRVVTAGFDECGVDDISEPKLTHVMFNDSENAMRGHHGQHEEVYEGNKRHDPELYRDEMAQSHEALFINF